MGCDVLVGNVGAAIDPHRTHQGIPQRRLEALVGDEYGLDRLDAYQLLTQVSESPVGNVCDPNYTFLCKVPKRYLPRTDAYDGTHVRQRGAAEEYRRGH